MTDDSVPSQTPIPLRDRVPVWSDRPHGGDGAHSSIAATRAPLFTRWGLDFQVLAPIGTMLEEASGALGLHRYRLAQLGTDPGQECMSSSSILAVPIDEPLDPCRYRTALQIEVQFMPAISQRTGRGAWRGDWAPILPSDLDRSSELAARITLIRQASQDGNGCVGGAIAAANVASDIPYLIDAGCDYVSLLTDGFFGSQPTQRCPLSDTERAIEAALVAMDKAGRPKGGLWVASASCSPRTARRWLAMGVQAVAIDAWLQDHAPHTSPRTTESFGGFLVDVARPEDRASPWLLDSVRGFLHELASEQRFAGLTPE
jgi:hypothetical protein